MESTRRIIGNLGCESDFAREDAQLRKERGEDAPSPRDPRFALPGAIETSLSAFATLLRAFAGEGDSLWTPRPVDPRRMADVLGLPLPKLESSPIEGLPISSRILAWAETPVVERLRAGSPRILCASADAQLAHAPWELPWPCAAAALASNHRAFCLETAWRLGPALPGARLVDSTRELERHLEHGGASAASGERWIVKAPLSAAGRSRVRGEGRTVEGAARRQLDRLLELHGTLLFEPWMDRTEDFGCCALLDENELRVLPPHRLHVDAHGGFRGIGLTVGAERCGHLSDAEEALLRETVNGVAGHLRNAGYSGPFGIDCWRYRDANGALRFHPLGEINARMSFGLVARAITERLSGSGVLDAGTDVLLRLGKTDELAKRGASGVRIIPLLLPSPHDPEAAWVEVAASPG